MKKRGMIIYVAVILLCCFFGLLFGLRNKELRNTIESNGIETTGTIVNRMKGIGDGGITTFAVKYDFYVDGKLVKSYQHLSGKMEYENAIIGMKYKVKYLPDEPNKKTIMYIDEPQVTEYKNISKERERILNTYKDAKVFLKKHARPLDEIKHLIGE